MTPEEKRHAAKFLCLDPKEIIFIDDGLTYDKLYMLQYGDNDYKMVNAIFNIYLQYDIKFDNPNTIILSKNSDFIIISSLVQWISELNSNLLTYAKSINKDYCYSDRDIVDNYIVSVGVFYDDERHLNWRYTLELIIMDFVANYFEYRDEDTVLIKEKRLHKLLKNLHDLHPGLIIPKIKYVFGAAN